MVMEKLGESLKGTLQKIAKSIFVDDKLINELVKDIQRALLQADVNVKLVLELTKNIKERVTKEDAPKGLDKKEHLINIVYEELTSFFGGKKAEIKIEKKKPFKIIMVGLFGQGKTTTSGKLAGYYAKRGFKVALVGLDTYRPAAMDQIEQVGKQVNVPTYVNKKEKNAVEVYKEFEKEFSKYDILLIDTAGRDALSDDLIKEIEDITNYTKPDEKLLVISADVGQAAQAQAEQFHKSCKITGVITTRMDGTAKAGGALTACAVTGAPIKFIGVGEKLSDLEPFNPQGFIGRLLGMGDLEALLDKAKDAITQEDAEDLGKKLLKGEFNLIDLYEQMQAMKKMGPLSKVVEMIPGMGQMKMPKEMLDNQDVKLDNWRYLMNSMTKEELEDPELITADRMERIAKGSGRSLSDIREMVKQFRQSKKMLKMVKGQDPEKLMKKLGGMQSKGMGKVKYK
ncbi:MAG: signal recognition particle receptor subunit alpha [Candidatus Woesearchaeota archaeon]|jgi:signal recognition particle subunit SRP54|nr:signal recognition particle receptor subunit alpha [Candidatus Woesearchaeota archaeon]MDP7457475.1 signal recognition particle receptor subunit alpha [Candidatus Woesearchaeota archaeon]